MPPRPPPSQRGEATGLPVSGVQGDSPWLVQVLPEKDLPGRPVEIGHLDAVGLRVCPVQFLANPVTGQAIRRHQARDDHVLHGGARLVQIGLLDGLLAHIRPVHSSLGELEIHRGRILQATDHNGGLQLDPAGVHQPHIPAVGKQQEW